MWRKVSFPSSKARKRGWNEYGKASKEAKIVEA